MANDITRREEHGPETVQQPSEYQIPAVDIYENEQEILLIADVPGVDRDHLHINLEKDTLTIEGRRTREEDPGAMLTCGFRDDDYFRSFTVPSGIDGEKVAAELDHGVLRLHLPKSEAIKPRQIKIKTK